MKSLALTAALMFAGSAVLADPVEGVWKTKPDDNGKFGHVQISPCGEKFCGVLIEAFDETGAPIDSPNVGKNIVWNMSANGDGTYGGGKVWAPDRDKTYTSRMSLSGSVLSVSGCVMGGLICRASDWTRVN